MSEQKQGGFFPSFRRISSGRRMSSQGEDSPQGSQTDLSSLPQNTYGSLSNESITDSELGAGLIDRGGGGDGGSGSISTGDMMLSPQSSVSDSRNNSGSGSGRGVSVMSPLMGELFVDTDGEDEADTDLLPIRPPRLGLPPTTPRGGSGSAATAATTAAYFPDSSYQNVNVAGESPSSVNAQPGDWHTVGLSYGSGTGNGGGGGAPNGSKDSAGNGIATTTANAAPSIWSIFSSNSSKNRPFAVMVRIVVILALLILATLLAVIMSSSNSGWWWSSGSGDESGSASGSSGQPTLVVPFPHVDRAAYGDPANKIVDPDLFDPRLLGTPSSVDTSDGGEQGGNTENDAQPSDSTGDTAESNVTRRRLNQAEGGSPVKDIHSASSLLKVPFPTGAFWTNLVLKPTSDEGLSYPIFAYPYGFKWSPTTLVTSYPPLRRKVDATSIRDVFNPDLTFGSEEAIANRHVLSFDPLSVSVRFLISDHRNRSNYWESYIVRGSPYVTIFYRAATPVITPLSIFKSVMCPRDESGKYNSAPAHTKEQIEKGDSGSDNDKQTTDSGAWGVCSSKSDGTSNSNVLLTGVQFLLQTQENLTWMVFASSPITFLYDGAAKRTVKAVEPFSGVLRFALVPPPADDSGVTGTGFPGIHDGVQLSSSSGVKRLIYHASVYPVAGHVTWEFQKEGSTNSNGVNQAISSLVGGGGTSGGSLSSINKYAKVKFEFDTLSMADASQGSTDKSSLHSQLLMLSLPHHAELMDGSDILKNELFDLEYHCIKGRMIPIVGTSWQYQETLPSLGFDDDDALTQIATMDGGIRQTILDQVKKDLVRVLPTFDENVYGFGKQVARLAQLVHISYMLSSPSAANKSHKANKKDTKAAPHTNAAFVQEGLDSLRRLLCTFLRDGQKDTLMFDSQFGGIVTKDGLEDTQADFGNGRFNDHHFHYGYLLYASAILGLYDPHFVHDYGAYVDSLLYDVAYSSNSETASVDDNFFPFTRHMNWYDGHSFASGLFPYGNGKSQESSSEAVNCYYGAYLWSKIRYGDGGAIDSAISSRKDGTDFARLLLAMEIRGAKTYWHMMPEKTKLTSLNGPALRVYNNKFAENYMVGNLGMLDAVCSTWFGTNKLYVHMINFVPLTAITPILFDETYVKEEFSNVISKLYDDVEMAWKGYVVGDRAIIDPNSAWEDAARLISYELDAALSLSQLLYFISTRKTFTVSGGSSSVLPGTGSDTYSLSNSTTSASACEVHPDCVDLGLSGECCPTPEGVNLGCCQSPKISESTEGSEPALAPSPTTSTPPPASNGEEMDDSAGATSASSCEAHISCLDLGLRGECCPTLQGNTLGCCDDGQ